MPFRCWVCLRNNSNVIVNCWCVRYTFNRCLCLYRSLAQHNTIEKRENQQRKKSSSHLKLKTRLSGTHTLIGALCMENSRTSTHAKTRAWCEWMEKKKQSRQQHKSETHRNNIPISFFAGIIMLCQCSFDSRCNLYRYYFVVFFFSCFGFGVQLTDPAHSSIGFL
jgi:hypothetical protein